MFTSKYRYGIIILLGAYSYINTLFTEVYEYYGIHSNWYDVMGIMIIITLVVWEANRLILSLLQRYSSKWPTARFLVVFFLLGMTASSLLTLAISYAGADWLQLTGIKMRMGTKLAFTYGTRINLFLHIINGIFIFNRQYKTKQLEAEEMKRINAQAQLQAIKNQVNPHFLFNNLNVLSGMVIRDNPEANTFIEEFSKVYRHILNSQDKELIPLATELEFIKPYIFLLEKRFPESISVRIDINVNYYQWLIVPASLQMLMENSIKHNILSAARPLQLTITVKNNAKIIVSNNLQLKPQIEESTQLGLKNIAQRYELIAGEHIEIHKNDSSFTVALPLIPPTT
ncbi:MAG: histidine kinase [Chitinophagaceae bacterium]